MVPQKSFKIGFEKDEFLRSQNASEIRMLKVMLVVGLWPCARWNGETGP